MLLDGLNHIQRSQVLAPATQVSATTATKAVDRRLSMAYASQSTYKVGGLGAGSITFIFNVGATSETWDASTTYLTLTLEESDDSTDGNDGTWTQVLTTTGLLYDIANQTLTSSAIRLTSSSTSDNKVYALGYNGDARWVRGKITEVGTQNTGTYLTVTVELGNLAMSPANNAGN